MKNRRNRYICKTCGFSFLHDKKPNFCIECGGKDFSYASKVSLPMQEIIQKCEELSEETRKKYDEYGKAWAQKEFYMQTLRTYVSRGILSKEELPGPIVTKKLTEYLEEYRNERDKTVV